MSGSVITSTSNPVVKRLRALRARRPRADASLFLVEGIHHVGEVLEAGWDVDLIVYAPDILESPFAQELVANNAERAQAVSAEVMDALSDKENPQGILAVARKRDLRLTDLASLRYGAALVSPQDPGNVGSILRTVDAAGGDCVVLLDGGVDPYHPSLVRASMGTLFWKPLIRAGFGEFIEWARARGIQVIGTSAHAPSSAKEFRPVEPWMLLLGSEQKGLSRDRMEACGAMVSLPMRGRASSLNLAVAAGILLYQFTS